MVGKYSHLNGCIIKWWDSTEHKQWHAKNFKKKTLIIYVQPNAVGFHHLNSTSLVSNLIFHQKFWVFFFFCRPIVHHLFPTYQTHKTILSNMPPFSLKWQLHMQRLFYKCDLVVPQDMYLMIDYHWTLNCIVKFFLIVLLFHGNFLCFY